MSVRIWWIMLIAQFYSGVWSVIYTWTILCYWGLCWRTVVAQTPRMGCTLPGSISKLLMNQNGLILHIAAQFFFPAHVQHRDDRLLMCCRSANWIVTMKSTCGFVAATSPTLAHDHQRAGHATLHWWSALRGAQSKGTNDNAVMDGYLSLKKTLCVLFI